MARSYGAALIVGCIDEDPQQAQAFTRERKLEIAERSYELLTGKYGIHAENIIFDPLVFPCATGDENYIGGAVETIEGIRLIKQNIPHVRTVLGISNVSFGLPAGARGKWSTPFSSTTAPRPASIWPSSTPNASSASRRFPRKSASSPRACCSTASPNKCPTIIRKLRFCAARPADWREQSREQKAAINQFHIAAISEHFRGAGGRKKAKNAGSAARPAPSNYILEGSKDGLIDDLNRKREEGVAPLDIINGPLMAGMAEVGRLFNNNELIVAEVLQSAEAMKAAVSHLEQFMEKADTEKRAKVILATVKGDVHDIGKNLVEIILKNNGYDVINLGIKVPPEDLIRAHEEHKPDAIGLSGLLVKSAQQMVTTAGDLRDAGIRVPLLVGGAALSEKFTRMKIAPQYQTAVCYAKDAMTGLRLMNELSDPKRRDAVIAGPHIYRQPSLRKKLLPRPSEPAGEERSAESSHRHPDSRRSPILTAKFARCRICTISGATSIPTCSSDATWASAGISKRPWASATRAPSNYSTAWRKSSAKPGSS